MIWNVIKQLLGQLLWDHLGQGRDAALLCDQTLLGESIRRHSQWSSGALFLSSEREGAHWCTLLILKKPGITRMWCKPQYPFALLWGRKELVSWRSPSEMGKGCRRGRGYLPDPCLGTCCEAPHAVWLKVRERQTTSVHTTSHDSLEAFLATTAMKSNAPQQK